MFLEVHSLNTVIITIFKNQVNRLTFKVNALKLKVVFLDITITEGKEDWWAVELWRILNWGFTKQIQVKNKDPSFGFHCMLPARWPHFVPLEMREFAGDTFWLYSFSFVTFTYSWQCWKSMECPCPEASRFDIYPRRCPFGLMVLGQEGVNCRI